MRFTSWLRRLSSVVRHSSSSRIRQAKRFHATAACVQFLEDRQVLVSTAWAAAVSGNFTDATKWTNGVPGPDDTAIIDATGASYTVTLDANRTVDNFALNSTDATFVANSKTFTVDVFAALTQGQVTWNNSTWAGAGPLVNSSRMTFQGNSRISSTWNQNGVVLVEGTSTSSTTLTVDVGFSNSGRFELDSSSASASANLAVTTGILTNAASGQLISNDGASLIGQGGSTLRSISANVVNDGTARFGTRTLLSLANGTFTNNGSATIDANSELSFGSNPTFTQADGLLDINASASFAMNGGTFGFNGGSLNGMPSLRGTALSLAANSNNTFEMFGGRLSGSLGAGQSIIQYGQVGNIPSSSVYLELSDNFVNNGSITVTTIAETTGAMRQSQRSALRMTNGTLVNNGTITFGTPSLGNLEPKIEASLRNDGTLNVNTGCVLIGQQHTNNGDINIAASGHLTVSSPTTFTQAGGNLRLATDETFALGPGSTFRFSGGAITGVPELFGPTLRLETTNPASFRLWGGGTLVGDVAAGQNLIVTNNHPAVSIGPGILTSATSFRNSGTITLRDSEDKLAVTTGTLTNDGIINAALPGTIDGRARLINANLTNNGTLNINVGTVLTGQQHTNNGDVNIATVGHLTVSGAPTFTQAGGNLRLTTDETFVMGSTSTFRYSGGAITGVPKLYGPTLRLETTNPASFRLMGGGTLIGDVAAEQTIVVVRDGINGAVLTSATGFQNAGTITLLGVDSRLAVTTGTLENNGVINASVIGTPDGPIFINASLTNNGTLNANVSTLLVGQQHTNNGDVNIAATAALGVSSGATFTQAGGNLRLTTDETFAASDGTFRYSGGLITGTPRLRSVTLDIGANSGPATISLRGGSTLIGNVLSGQTILVQADTSGAATLTSANGFTNSGTINLQSIAASASASNLTVTTGTLTNGGVINANVGGGGVRTITAELANSGIVNINTSITLGRASADHVNSGLIDVVGGNLTVSQSGTTPTFTNSSTINIASGRTLNTSGGSFAQTAGVTTVNGTLTTTHVTGVNIQGGVLQGDGDIIGNVRNAGQVGPGNSAGRLDITGNYTQTTTGTLNIEIGGPTAVAQFDQINITGVATLDGTLNLVLVNAYIPATGDSFQVGMLGTRSGEFTITNGRAIPGSLRFAPRFTSAGLQLDVEPNAAPVFTSEETASVAENSTSVRTVTASDADGPAVSISFSITGGADSEKFTITSGGVLTFNAAPSFDMPADANADNIYEVIVQAADGTGGVATQMLSVSVTAVPGPRSVLLPSGGGGIAILVNGNDLVVRSTSGVEFFRLPVPFVTLLTINGSSGADLVAVLNSGTAVTTPLVFNGSDGNDQFDASLAGAAVTLHGSVGLDTLTGSAFADSLNGDSGNDILTGGAGSDVISGGAGVDLLVEIQDFNMVLSGNSTSGTLQMTLVTGAVQATDTLGSIEAVSLRGGSSGNRIDASQWINPSITTLVGGGGRDTIIGSPGRDRITTFSSGRDSILGGAGDDTIATGNGDDTIDGGDGIDSIQSQVGNDSVIGGSGDDNLVGSEGNDTLLGQDGDDRLFGLSESDLLDGGNGNDSLFGASENDTLLGGADRDLLRGGPGTDSLNGGTGIDRVDESVDADVTIVGMQIQSAVLGTETAVSVERFLLSGGASGNLFNARLAAVEVLLTGNGGDDTLLGGSASDTVRGNDGNDVLSGGPGTDVIEGGPNTDMWFESANANFTVTGLRIVSTATTDETGVEIERIVLEGGTGNNNLNASAATVPVLLLGGLGNDTLTGGNSNDTLTGGFRGDSTVAGSDGLDSLTGGAGIDRLKNDPSDTLSGETLQASVFSLLPVWLDLI